MKIHAALMTQSELTDLVVNIAAVLPHVDSVTIVDGGSLDGAIPYVRNWSRGEPKIRLFIHPWRDNFPAQRNHYLAHVAEIAREGDWVLSFDPDEILDDNALANLRSFADEAHRRRCGRVGFRCRSVSYRGPQRVWQNDDDYWKGLLYRWSPKLQYAHDGEGTVHEILRGLSGPDMNLGQTPGTGTYFYEHRKQEDVIWVRGVRNYFMGGGGPNLGRKNPQWVELREWCAANLGIPFEMGVKGHWQAMHAYLLAGDIHPWLRDWIIRASKETGWDGSSESREWAKTVYRLYHPHLEPPELRGVHIP